MTQKPKTPDKQALLVGILRLCKDQGLPPPPDGVEIRAGAGRCMTTYRKIIVYQEAHVNDWLAQVVTWVQHATDLMMEAARPLATVSGHRPDETVNNRFKRLEMDPIIEPIVVHDPLVKGRVEQLEYE